MGVEGAGFLSQGECWDRTTPTPALKAPTSNTKFSKIWASEDGRLGESAFKSLEGNEGSRNGPESSNLSSIEVSKPPKRLEVFPGDGTGQSATEFILEGSIWIGFWVTKKPRK